MKRLLLFAAAVLGMFAAFSCQEKEEILTLTSTTYTVSNAGSVQTISFNASTDWTMVSEAEWISLDKTSGIAGPATVTMTVAIQPFSTILQTVFKSVPLQDSQTLLEITMLRWNYLFQLLVKMVL